MKQIDHINWNEIWKEVVYNRTGSDENKAVSFWDDFAPHYRRKNKEGDKDVYVDSFYELMEVKTRETIFDMGCASGTLAIPYAKKGHEIYAADFSPKMLEVLMKDAEDEGVAGMIHPIKLDWNEDWSKRNLPECDIAISSRSSLFSNLTDALKKLESVATRRVCMGVWDMPTKSFDRYVAKAIGYERPGMAPHSVIMGELLARDVHPEMLVINTPFRLSRYTSFEEGVEELRHSFINGLTDEQDQRLVDYCQKHMVRKRDNEEYWQLDHSELSTIAFIRWDKENI